MYKYFILLILIFTACQKVELLNKIDRREAFEIINILNEYGIPSKSTQDRQGDYLITVTEADYLKSISLLHKFNLPRSENSKFEKLTKQSGLLPNSREIESLRIDRALAVEVEEVLKKHNLIVDANVIVRRHIDSKDKSAVSSVIILDREIKVEEKQAINDLIINSIPNSENSKIKVLFSLVKQHSIDSEEYGIINDGKITVPLVSFLIWKVPYGTHKEIALSLLGIILIVLTLAGSLGYFVGRRKKTSDMPMLTTAISRNQLPNIDKNDK